MQFCARCIVVLLAWSGLAHAEDIVELQVPGGLWASAQYRVGDADKPAVLLLHGFLQTRNFPTVNRLASALAESGYTVLTPSLTLGINRRQRSLDCEALHTHDMQQDLREINAWAHWLQARHKQPPVLIGHSAGSIQLLAYVAGKPQISFGGVGLISLTYFGKGPAAHESEADRIRAEQALAAGSQAPQYFGLSFCRNYLSPPAAYLSYLKWGADRLAEAAAGTNPHPWIIYGGSDQRLDKAWLTGLKRHGATLHRVPGANHFFDKTNEFDLLEAVEMLLSGEEPGA